MLQKVKETVDYIESHVDFKPEVGMILGSGLGRLAEEIEVRHVLPYKDIPHFPVSTVEGHCGRLIFGVLSGKNVVAMQGRFHYYEGYAMTEVTFPVRVLKFLGIRMLFVSNAAGGMNPSFRVGDIMAISDHINLMPNPLIGKHYPEFGPRFVDMSEAYDKKFLKLAQRIADRLSINLQMGVYVGTTGPTYETPHEYNYMQCIGGDAVGMSTVPEVIIARQMGIPVFAISVITDLGGKNIAFEVSHEEVLNAASVAEPKMSAIVKALLEEIQL